MNDLQAQRVSILISFLMVLILFLCEMSGKIEKIERKV
jgi:hypothetical protein